MEKRIHDAEFELAEPGAIRGYQLKQLQKLLAKTRAENRFFAEHWVKAGADLARVDSLDAFNRIIPTVEKADFVEDQKAHPPYGWRHAHLLSLGIPFVTLTSSGTSGYGVEIHLQTNTDMINHGRLTGYYFRWAGLKPADSLLLTMHISMLAGGRCEYHAALDYGLSVLPAAMYDTDRRIDLIKRFSPTGLFGTSSYFGHLAAIAGESARDLGLKVLLTGAEATSVPWFQKLEMQFGARVYDRYGLSPLACDHMFSCERGIGTLDQPGILHNIDPFVLLEVIDPKTGRHVADGEEGEIVLTSLYRDDTPMIRCRTRDRGIYRAPGTCACGRPFSGVQLGSVGRMDDMKKVKGINIWPQALEDVVFANSAVEEYQVVLSTEKGAGDVATLRLMCPAGLDEARRTRLQAEMTKSVRDKIGIGFVVEIVEPGAFSRSEYKARRWIDRREHVQS